MKTITKLKFKYFQRDGGYNKSEILNHLMEILITSDKSYENLALQILSEDTILNKRYYLDYTILRPYIIRIIFYLHF